MAKIAVIGLSGQSIFMKVNNLPTPSTTIHSTNLYIEPGGKGSIKQWHVKNWEQK